MECPVKARYLILAQVLLQLLAPLARADQDVKLAGLWSYSSPIFVPSQGTVTPGQAWGYGILLDWPVIKRFKIDYGLLSLPRKYTAGSSSVEVGAWHLPVVGHYMLAPTFAVGFGGYYELGAAGAQSFSTLGFQTRGYGAIFSAVYDSPLMPGIGWFVDARLLLGIRDLSLDGNSTARFNDAVAITGLRLGFGR